MTITRQPPRPTPPLAPSMAKCRVLVCEHLDGTIAIYYGPNLLGRYHPTVDCSHPLQNRAAPHEQGTGLWKLTSHGKPR